MKSFESHIIVSNMKYMSAQSDTMSHGAHTEQYLHFVLDISDYTRRYNDYRLDDTMQLTVSSENKY